MLPAFLPFIKALLIIYCDVQFLYCSVDGLWQFLNLFPFRYFPGWKTLHLLLSMAYNVSGKEMECYAWLRMSLWRTQSEVVHFCDAVSMNLTSVIHCFHKTSLTDVSELLNTTSVCMNLVSDMNDYVFENCSQQYE
jgi:hypothetical protein